MAEGSGDKELTGIERELVLQYLKDDNVPVTVTLEEKPEAVETDIENNKTDGIEPSSRIPASAMFPVAIPSEQLEVLNQGIILLKKSDRSVQPFLGKKVRVQFYFNHVGLYFITTMKECSKGLAIVIPSSIRRVAETSYRPNYSFSGILSYTVTGGREVNIDCIPLKGYNLFVQPKWDDIEIECQKSAKAILETIVMEARIGNSSSIGNGLQLFPIVRYLTDPHQENTDAVEGKAKPFHIVYVDEKKLVLASADSSTELQLEEEYNIKLTFNLAENSMLKRVVCLNVYVENIYNTANSARTCYVCKYTNIQQEDIRFIYEKISQTV